MNLGSGICIPRDRKRELGELLCRWFYICWWVGDIFKELYLFRHTDVRVQFYDNIVSSRHIDITRLVVRGLIYIVTIVIWGIYILHPLAIPLPA